MNYDKEIKGSMIRINQLISSELRAAIDVQDCQDLESKIEHYFDLIRGIVKRVRADIAEELTA